MSDTTSTEQGGLRGAQAGGWQQGRHRHRAAPSSPQPVQRQRPFLTPRARPPCTGGKGLPPVPIPATAEELSGTSRGSGQEYPQRRLPQPPATRVGRLRPRGAVPAVPCHAVPVGAPAPGRAGSTHRPTPPPCCRRPGAGAGPAPRQPTAAAAQRIRRRDVTNPAPGPEQLAPK